MKREARGSWRIRGRTEAVSHSCGESPTDGVPDGDPQGRGAVAGHGTVRGQRDRLAGGDVATGLSPQVAA